MAIVANHAITTTEKTHRAGELISYLPKEEEQRLVKLGAAFYAERVVAETEETVADDLVAVESAEVDDQTVFEAMTRAELKAYGEVIGVSFTGKEKHADMVAAIMASDADIDLDALPMSALTVMATAEGIDVVEHTEEELRDMLAGA